MANILVLATLCVVIGVGLIQARYNANIPKGFFYYDPEFALRPQKVEDLGNNRVVFKFGDEKNRMSHLWLNRHLKKSKSNHLYTANERFILFLFRSHSQSGGEELHNFRRSYEHDKTKEHEEFHDGYPNIYLGNTNKRLTYAEITIEGVRKRNFSKILMNTNGCIDFIFYSNSTQDFDTPNAKFVFWREPPNGEEPRYTYFRYAVIADNVKKIIYTLKVYVQ